jgi:hypothetical protein
MNDEDIIYEARKETEPTGTINTTILVAIQKTRKDERKETAKEILGWLNGLDNRNTTSGHHKKEFFGFVDYDTFRKWYGKRFMGEGGGSPSSSSSMKFRSPRDKSRCLHSEEV